MRKWPKEVFAVAQIVRKAKPTFKHPAENGRKEPNL
jgi:hypothetical protein